MPSRRPLYQVAYGQCGGQEPRSGEHRKRSRLRAEESASAKPSKEKYLLPTAFIYSEKYQTYDYGPQHPLKMIRLKLTYELLKAYGVFESPDVLLIEPEPVRKEEVTRFHDDEYIKTLKAIDSGIVPPDSYRFGLGLGDNPIFRGVYEGSLLAAGASIQAARMVETARVSTAFNIAGGLHHAFRDRAAGFCYINDPVLAIIELISRGKKVAYIDIDAHHGDGVQAAFYDTNKVLTVSLHESGEFLFPGTGFIEEIGRGEGKGYSVNLPFYPGTGDEVFVRGFEEIVPPLVKAFKPDVIVTQLGADSFAADPLTHLELTTNGFCRMIEIMKSFNIPWVALGGGGYNVTNVARAWALAFAIMSNINLSDEIPQEPLYLLRRYEFQGKNLRDPIQKKGSGVDQLREWALKGIRYIKENVFPIHGITN